MPKSVGEYLNTLFTKAGIPADNQKLKDLLSSADLSKVNIPDDLIEMADAGIHTLDSAKAKLRSVLKTELLGETFSTINGELDTIASENEFDDASKAELAAEKNTYNRIKIVANKIKALEAAKSGSSKGDKAELQNEINKLKAEQSKIGKDWESKLAQKESEFQIKYNGLTLDTMLSRYQYALGEIDPEVKVLTAKGIFDKALREANARIINDDSGQLKLVAHDGTDFYDKGNNKKDLKSFLEGAIAPILSTTKAPAPGKTTPITIDGKATSPNQKALAELEASAAQLG